MDCEVLILINLINGFLWLLELILLDFVVKDLFFVVVVMIDKKKKKKRNYWVMKIEWNSLM